MVTLLPGGMLFTFNSKCWEGGGLEAPQPIVCCVYCCALRVPCVCCGGKKKVNQKAVSEK